LRSPKPFIDTSSLEIIPSIPFGRMDCATPEKLVPLVVLVVKNIAKLLRSSRDIGRRTVIRPPLEAVVLFIALILRMFVLGCASADRRWRKNRRFEGIIRDSAKRSICFIHYQKIIF
jgi:hypothetical protein